MSAFYNEVRRLTAYTTAIYLVTNLQNGRGYVGMTRRGVQRRWRGHVQSSKTKRTALGHAIAKYGEDSFEVITLAYVIDEYAPELEILLIKEWSTLAPDGYNLTTGGYGVHGLSQETIKTTSAKNTGRTQSLEARAAISRAGKGRIVSPETRAKISAGHKGKTLSLEHRAKLSMAKIGKPRPPKEP